MRFVQKGSSANSFSNSQQQMEEFQRFTYFYPNIDTVKKVATLFHSKNHAAATVVA